MCGILAVGVGLPLLSAFATGAIAIPHNDDWAFSRVALTLSETGELRLVGWGQMSLVGHVLWAQPFLAVFGESQQVLHLSQALAAGTGLVLAYFVVRMFLPSGLGLFATALLALFPGYALLSTTFMTDTTAFAAQMGCLLAGLVALEKRSDARRLLALSLLLGLFAYTIREIAIAAPLAVLGGRLVALRTPRQRRGTVALLALMLLFAAAFSIWRHRLPGDDEALWLIAGGDYSARVEQLVRAFFTCAFAALPALLLVLPRFARELFSLRLPLAAAALVLALGAVITLRQPAGPFTLFTGNSLTRQGAVPVTLSGRDVLFPAPIWIAMTVGALLAGGLLIAILVTLVQRILERERSNSQPADASGSAPWFMAPNAVLVVYAILPALLLVLRAASGAWVLFDRYFWGIELSVLVVVLRLSSPARATARSGRWLAGGAAALLAAVSLILVVEENTSSTARWNAGKAAVSAGISADDIDAGFEWMGWHYPGIAGADSGRSRWREPASWYNALEFPAAANCILMSYMPRRESWLRLVEIRSFRPFLLWGRRELFVYRNPPACR
jgi:hypothetical protein